MSEFVIRSQIHELLSQVSIYITKDSSDNRLCIGIIAKLLITSLILSLNNFILFAFLPISIVPVVYILNRQNESYKKEIQPHIIRLNYLLSATIKNFKYIESELTFLLECQKTCVLVTLSMQIIRWTSALGIILCLLISIYK